MEPLTKRPRRLTVVLSDRPLTRRRAQAVGQNALGANPPSRGYREEMEHLAFCIRMRDQGMARDRELLQPRCPGVSVARRTLANPPAVMISRSFASPA